MIEIIITIAVWELVKFLYKYLFKSKIDAKIKSIKDKYSVGGELPIDDDEIT